MKKNFYLSRGEQSLRKDLPPDMIGTTEEIAGLFPEMSHARINKINSSLASKGYIQRLKKGTYLFQGKPSEIPVITDPYKIALSLFKGYIGFSSALRIYSLLDYEPFTIFVVSKNKSGEKKIGEYTFKAVAMGKKAVGMTYHDGIYLSTIAKTFFDCFYKPQYGGGYAEITKALHDAKIDWKEFKQYLELGTDAFCQRTGYILDMVNKETNRIPDEILEYLSGRIHANIKLIPSGRSAGKYNREWKVMDNLGRDNILSWWYHG